MLQAVDGGSAAKLPPVPPPPQPQPQRQQQPYYVPPPPQPPPQPQGESLASAEATVRALVAQGLTGAQALAQHPLPPGTSTADALAFLATLPQTTYQIGDVNSGVVTGPPIAQVTSDGPFVDPSEDPSAFDGFDFVPYFPEGGNTEAIVNDQKILRGHAFVNSVRSHCSALGVDPLAAFANAMAEGLSGHIGDTGTAYGPWQIHLEDGRMQQFAGDPLYSPIVQAWAWTDNGVEYAIRSMVSGGAKGLKGHAAVHAIVYGFEKPQDEAGAYKLRASNYDYLVAKAGGVDNYIANLANGPALTTTTGGGAYVPTEVPTATPVSNVPTSSVWKELMSFLAHDVPFAATHTETVSDEIVKLVK